MRYPRSAMAAVVILVSACVPQVAAQQPDNPQPADNAQQQANNPPLSTALTCSEFNLLLHAKRSGYATIWLDGYYSSRAGLKGLPAGWIRTLAQGVGGACAISVNDPRSVLDVIAQLHREYGDKIAARP